MIDLVQTEGTNMDSINRIVEGTKRLLPLEADCGLIWYLKINTNIHSPEFPFIFTRNYPNPINSYKNLPLPVIPKVIPRVLIFLILIHYCHLFLEGKSH
jgi:hypothetical protein